MCEHRQQAIRFCLSRSPSTIDSEFDEDDDVRSHSAAVAAVLRDRRAHPPTSQQVYP
ncbi:hypothetical protein V3C99_013683 [Haemonchus contortus]